MAHGVYEVDTPPTFYFNSNEYSGQTSKRVSEREGLYTPLHGWLFFLAEGGSEIPSGGTRNRCMDWEREKNTGRKQVT